MSFFSSAGPATVRRPTPSSSRMICASVVLPRPGRPGEQHVVERLAAPLGGVEGDAELLLDPLLADEVVEPARAQRALELLVLGVQHGVETLSLTRNRLAPASGDKRARQPARSAWRTRSAGGSSGSTSARRCSASSTRVAELDERVARDEVRGAGGRDGGARRRP